MKAGGLQNPELVKNLHQKYLATKSLRVVAKEAECSISSLYEAFAREGLEIQPFGVHRKFPIEFLDDMIQDFNNGYLLKEIGERWQVHPSNLRYWFQKRGIQPRSQRDTQRLRVEFR